MTRTNCILTLSNGHHVDLLNPRATDIDFNSIAEHLAKENRYNGATPGLTYSVAEHTARGVEAILSAGDDKEVARYFLLHDCPEAFLKDDTTPKKKAIGAVAEAEFGVLAATITGAFDRLTDRFDAVIHEAAGVSWPPPREVAEAVKRWDLRMFVTEWRDLMGGIDHPEWAPYATIEPLDVAIMPWTWTTARRVFLHHCDALLPAMQRKVSK
jgi:5'-deoxynucleotidase YfbR-like HD superfamily hydrolase